MELVSTFGRAIGSATTPEERKSTENSTSARTDPSTHGRRRKSVSEEPSSRQVPTYMLTRLLRLSKRKRLPKPKLKQQPPRQKLKS